MRFSECKRAEDFDRLLGELMELKASYDRTDIVSTPGLDPDPEKDYCQMRQECDI